MLATMRIVCTGDSVTDCGRREDPQALGHGYVRLLAEGPLSGHEVRNTGISGNRLTDLAERWADDVLAAEPGLLSVLIGVNDTWRRYDAGLLSPVDDFERRYRDLLTSLPPTTRVVLLEPFLLPVTEEQQVWWTEDLAARVEAVHRIADDHDAVLVPTHQALTAAATEVGNAALAADGVHPTAEGHRLIADLWWHTVAPTLA